MPGYIEHDLGLPKEMDYSIRPWNISFLSWDWHWTDITYDVPNFDIKDIVFLMERRYDQPMLKIDFPAVKEW